MPRLITSESVSEGHPDKVSDQISDAVLDALLIEDPESKCACETFVTTGLVIVGGEIKTETYIDVQQIAREVIKNIGYTKAEYKFQSDSCGVMNAIHEQSSDIRQGVDRGSEEEQGAGDQGMMFGYATNETDNYMPLPIDLSHRILQELVKIRKKGDEMTYLAPDSKSQVTVEYDKDNNPVRVDTIVVSTQHDEDVSNEQIKKDIINILIPRVKASYPERVQKLFGDDIKYHVNPTGKFVIGGPHGDAGLTGRKIIVDTYGGKGAHGGGAFSGKDSSKVDRSAAYATRHVAKNLVAAGVADRVEVQVAYAIGVAEPVSIDVNTFGTSKVGDDEMISKKIREIFDMRPGVIVKRLGLKNPIFLETAAYGHMGRIPGTKTIQVNGQTKTVETFTWEKLDYVDKVKEAFGL
jgi:S-adenosylmethionine synthetase